MKNANDSTVMTSPEYRVFIKDLKTRVISARICGARAMNRDMILLYWDIGRGIVEKQQVLGWGDAVVEMVAAGFSTDDGIFAAQCVEHARALCNLHDS
jgi:hypothetical protein